eukprot:5654694-Alexandrium_andersonii.AAC.1
MGSGRSGRRTGENRQSDGAGNPTDMPVRAARGNHLGCECFATNVAPIRAAVKRVRSLGAPDEESPGESDGL